MKIKVWIVTAALPEPGAGPCLPQVFGSEAEAEACAESALQEEWATNGPIDPDDSAVEATLPYPGNWREANDQLKRHIGADWGEWQITAHEIEIGEAVPIEALTYARHELLEAADKFHVIHCNHPGERCGRAQGEDKAFLATMSERMMKAVEHIDTVAVSVARGAGPSFPEYLDRFPPEARPYCDRAYQDGYEDGAQSERDDRAAQVAAEAAGWRMEGERFVARTEPDAGCTSEATSWTELCEREGIEVAS